MSSAPSLEPSQPAGQAPPLATATPPAVKTGVFSVDEPLIYAVREVSGRIESKILRTTGGKWKGQAVKYDPTALSRRTANDKIKLFAQERGLDTILFEYGGNKPETGWTVLTKSSEITESVPPIKLPKEITPTVAFMGMIIIILAAFALISFQKGERTREV